MTFPARHPFAGWTEAQKAGPVCYLSSLQPRMLDRSGGEDTSGCADGKRTWADVVMRLLMVRRAICALPSPILWQCREHFQGRSIVQFPAEAPGCQRKGPKTGRVEWPISEKGRTKRGQQRIS